MSDEIRIENLELRSCIGVTPEERESAQRLTVSITLEPVVGFAAAEDRLENAVDYFRVCEAVKELAGRGERQLIETLAGQIGELVLGQFEVRRVEVELRKYILPDTEFVAVRLTRARE